MHAIPPPRTPRSGSPRHTICGSAPLSRRIRDPRAIDAGPTRIPLNKMIQIFRPSVSRPSLFFAAITKGSHTHQTGMAIFRATRKTGTARLICADPPMVPKRAKSRLKRASASSRQTNDRPTRPPILITVRQEDARTLHLDLYLQGIYRIGLLLPLAAEPLIHRPHPIQRRQQHRMHLHRQPPRLHPGIARRQR